MKTEIENPAQNERVPFSFENGARILDIRHEPVFNAVFTRDTAESRGALSDFISTLIGRTITVETIVVNEPPTSCPEQKKIRYNIACISESGEPIDVEMSFNPVDDELGWTEYFVSRLFVRQNVQNIDDVHADLNETYQISILTQKLFFPDTNLKHTFQRYDPIANVSLHDRIRIITLELEKSAQFIDRPVQEMSATELWAAFFQYLTSEEKRDKIIEIINRRDGIAMAANALSQVSAES